MWGGGENKQIYFSEKRKWVPPRRASRLQVNFEPWDDNDTEPYQISM